MERLVTAYQWRYQAHSRNLKHLLMNLLQCIDSLLQLNIIGRKLGLEVNLVSAEGLLVTG